MLTGAYSFFCSVAIVYLLLFILDSFAKFWWRSGYAVLQKRSGIYVQLFAIRCFTPRFGRCIRKLSTWRPKFQKAWFTFGTWVTLFSLPFALFFVVQSTAILFINTVWKETKTDKSLTPFLEPAIPGVNIPVSDIGHYVISLLICSIFHEFGHASAAVREGLHVTGLGVFVLFIVPVAFVHIEGLENLSSSKQLRVLCAGVWHNIILAFGGSLVLFLLPWLCYPFYDYGNGVRVVSIHKNSPLQEEGGLSINDIVSTINGCRVLTQDSWINCIYQTVKNPVSGYCITSEFIHENDESVRVIQLRNAVECCSNNTFSNICFEYLEKVDNPLELPQYSCLNARAVIEQSGGSCRSPSDCLDSQHCFRPSLPNGTKLIEIERKGRSKVLFLGHPIEILHGVHISEYVESTAYLPASIPNVIGKFCNFLIMFSGALAAVNLVPCFHFDGQHIARLLVHIGLAKNVRLKSVRLAVALLITILGSCILALYTILIFFSTFLK